MAECSVDGCDRGSTRRGWCPMHYQRWRMTGDPLATKWALPRQPRTVQWLLRKVEWSQDDCWLWRGALNDGGYGMVAHEGKRTRSHRAVYERLIGPIPAGLDLDHLCRNRACCNPQHLEPVTRQENLRRGIGPDVTRQRHAARRLAASTGGQ